MAAGRVHGGSIRPQMELSFAPSNRKCSVSIALCQNRLHKILYVHCIILFFTWLSLLWELLFKGTCNTDLWRDYERGSGRRQCGDSAGRLEHKQDQKGVRLRKLVWWSTSWSETNHSAGIHVPVCILESSAFYCLYITVMINKGTLIIEQKVKYYVL